MRKFVIPALLVACVLAAACGGGGGKTAKSDDTPTPTLPTVSTPADPTAANPSATKTTAGTTSGAGSAVSTTAAPADTVVALNPSIEQALSCRVPALLKAPPAGSPDLERHDLTEFPRASCNDGSPAVMYFRPYEGEANRNKWIIVMNGGGSCDQAQDCANRWCGVDTNFDADNMSSKNAAKGVGGSGILARQAGNPFANYNQVEVRYCSSDLWSGQGLAVSAEATDPKTGKDVSYQINFGGAYVFQAVMATLRKDGVQGLVYSKGNKALPDLDDATDVVLAGGSAGGAGVVFNLDRLADMLRGGPNKPVVLGFIEAIIGPDESKLGFASTTACKEHGLCSYEAYYKAIYAVQQAAGGPMKWTDESCLTWHKQNQPGTEWQCYDMNHLLANHITTPYFVRSSLTDALRSSALIDAGFSAADGKPLTTLSYGLATSAFLTGLQTAIKAGHEANAVSKEPGIFAPTCHTHYTLLENNLVAGVTINGPGDKAYALFDVWNNWVAGKTPDVVVSSDPKTDKCPGER
jgi:hypothetical protein